MSITEKCDVVEGGVGVVTANECTLNLITSKVLDAAYRRGPL